MASASSPEPAVLPALGSDPRRKSRSTKRYSGSRSPSGKDAHGKEVPGLSHETPGDAPTAAPPPPWLARILPRTLRERTVNLARLVAQSLAPEAKAHVDDLRVSLLSGGQGIELGPGTFDGGEDNGNFVATFATADHDGDAPLKAQLRIPLGEGALHASLSGGPVKLPILQKLSTSAPVGTKSARFSGNLDLSLDARLAVKGDVEVQGLSVDHPALASTPLEGLDLGVALDGVIEESGAIAVGASTLRVGKARIGLAGKYTPAEGLGQGDLRVDLAPISCDDLLYSVPSALLPLIQGAHLSGAFGAQAHIAFDQDALDKLVLDTHFSSQCEFVEVPAALARARLRSSFAHRIYLADGTMEDRITGPAEANWSPATWTSPYMQAAVLSSEDGGFFKHKGFSMGAFRGALIADLKAGRFVRGASTISMQLAKNLFLTREKTLSRKLEELLLTSYLEQVLTKDEMLETYFNVIEYGPDVYGIKEAAEHYFDSTPHELTVAQAFFLASILPSPARYHSMYEAGAIGAGWRKYLDRLMMNAEKVGLLSPEEARNGMAEILEFASNGKTVSTAKQPLGPQRGSRRPTRDLDQDTGHPGVDWSLGP
jgi:hypothetical protein